MNLREAVSNEKVIKKCIEYVRLEQEKVLKEAEIKEEE